MCFWHIVEPCSLRELCNKNFKGNFFLSLVHFVMDTIPNTSNSTSCIPQPHPCGRNVRKRRNNIQASLIARGCLSLVGVLVIRFYRLRNSTITKRRQTFSKKVQTSMYKIQSTHLLSERIMVSYPAEQLGLQLGFIFSLEMRFVSLASHMKISH